MVFWYPTQMHSLMTHPATGMETYYFGLEKGQVKSNSSNDFLCVHLYPMKGKTAVSVQRPEQIE